MFKGTSSERKDNIMLLVIKTNRKKKPNELQIDAKNKKAVFMQLDSTKFLFSNASIKEILFYVNLDDEEIISKENVFI